MAKTFVVGFDASEAASRALDRAIEEAREAHGRVVVVTVDEMPLNPEGPQNFGSLDDNPVDMIPLVEPPELEPLLAAARARVDAAGIPADYLWAAGEPAGEILAVAREQKADAIVLGAHHHGLFGRLLGQDVAAGVRREADCDVLVVE
jgi:nucleotide-binding universal stress UspA family protein